MKKQYLLKDLFLYLPKNKKRFIRRKKCVSFEFFKKIISENISNLNILNNEFLKSKYKIYKLNFNISNKINTEILGFYSKYNTKIEFYLSRGWSKEKSKEFLKKRQTIYTEEKLGKKKFEIAKQKHLKTYITNFKKGNHKIFFRPSQLEYWINKGFNIDDSKKQMFKFYSSLGKKYHKKRIEKGKEFLTVRQLKYWINKGLSIEDAKLQLRKIQDTRSLKSYIERYGKEGIIKYNETIKKWLFTLNNKSDEEKLDILIRKTKRFKRYSKKSIDLFTNVLNFIKEKHQKEFNIFLGENEYFIYDNEKKKINFYDLTIKDLNLIVEYNGIMFHPNKNLLSSIEWKNWKNIYSKISADEQFKKDNYKEKIAKENKFNYLIIWENESYEESFNKILNKIYELWTYK